MPTHKKVINLLVTKKHRFFFNKKVSILFKCKYVRYHTYVLPSLNKTYFLPGAQNKSPTLQYNLNPIPNFSLCLALTSMNNETI